MRSYPKYKSSGVEWLGKIPSNWNVAKLKYLGKTLIGVTYSPLDIVDESNGILVLRSSNIQNGKADYNSCVYLRTKISDELITRKGDILLCARNGSVELVGKNICIDETSEGFTFGAFMTIYRSKYWRFFSYFFNSEIFKAQSGLFSTSTINQLTNDTLRTMKVAFPSTIEEQQKIVDFLDYKTGECDRFIRNRQKQIELLNEQLRFKINQAITKGINSKVKFKATDIKYVPEIPDHWDIRKFKSLTSILTCGVAATPEYVEKNDGVLFLSAQNVKPFRMVFDKLAYIKPELHEKLTRNKKPIKGDVLVTRIGGDSNIGDACVVSIDSEFSVYVSLTHIRPNKEILSEYIVYFFNTEYCYQLNHEGTVVAGGQGNLNVKNVERYRIPLPPVEEQKEIITYLDNYRKEIDNLISKYQKQIELMQEYRTALISQAVTGKIDVRDWEPQTK
jgi:type I restriction enzyme S subunit